MHKNVLFVLLLFGLISCTSRKVIDYIPNMEKDSYYKNNYTRFIDTRHNHNENLDDIILFYQNLPDTMININLPPVGMISCRTLIDKEGSVNDILLLTRTNSQIDNLIIETIRNSKFKKFKTKSGEYTQYSIIISYPYCNHRFETPLLNGQPIFNIQDSMNVCNDSTNIEYSKPIVLNLPTPVYPPSARKYGFQGKVDVMVLVNKQGFVEYAKPMKTVNISIDNAAEDAAMLIRMKPAIQRHRKVKVRMSVPFYFSLNKPN